MKILRKLVQEVYWRSRPGTLALLVMLGAVAYLVHNFFTNYYDPYYIGHANENVENIRVLAVALTAGFCFWRQTQHKEPLGSTVIYLLRRAVMLAVYLEDRRSARHATH